MVTSSSPVFPFSMLFKYWDMDRCAADIVRVIAAAAAVAAAAFFSVSSYGAEVAMEGGSV